ncbi:glycosyltransferase [Microbacterium sp. LRZ72]|uniref:glycosyltransferase family A protein n=1 Tax=Microbacterium sp. LRZ72 TaxID=2942481 RepID=UPI0029B5EC2E|nr:glycosyltransferase family 2 protein [Microbacterium sp. LRZ72]MDX2376102.1 glycosyltransferase [Microbacterium sp. LRZ72]
MDDAAPTTPDSFTVSVVVPVKDDAEPLARCLAALADQTRPADEIIVVDNASVDASADVASAAGVTLLRCTEPGIPATSARGYDAATGDLILRLDADCLPTDTWIEHTVAAFAARPDVAAFTGGARFIDGPAALRAPLAAVYLCAYALALVPALGHLPLFGSHLAFRAAAWQRIRRRVHRHDDIHDDVDLAFHIGERHRIRYLPGITMGISMRPFFDPAGLVVRVDRGFRSVIVHWPRDFPPLRWARLILVRTTGRMAPAATAVR